MGIFRYLFSRRSNDRSEEARRRDQHKALGDEHHYGFGRDPAADDKVDNRLIVSKPGEDVKVHAVAGQDADPTKR